MKWEKAEGGRRRGKRETEGEGEREGEKMERETIR